MWKIKRQKAVLEKQVKQDTNERETLRMWNVESDQQLGLPWHNQWAILG